MIKSWLISILSLIIITGCASSDPKLSDTYPNLTKLKQPDNEPHREGKVYIDSVTQVTVEDDKALLISGKFADGCTHLQSISHSDKEETLQLTISAWRPTDKMCTQVLVPFSYIYQELSESQIDHYSDILINGKTYSI